MRLIRLMTANYKPKQKNILKSYPPPISRLHGGILVPPPTNQLTSWCDFGFAIEMTGYQLSEDLFVRTKKTLSENILDKHFCPNLYSPKILVLNVNHGGSETD